MDLIPRLKELGIYEVWVRCRDLEFLEDMFDEGSVTVSGMSITR